MNGVDPRAAEALENIVYIGLPGAFGREVGQFRPDPAIPLPVETGGAGASFDPRSLTGEALVAGMLRVLAWNPGHEHAAYYRAFVRAVKPELLAVLSEAGVLKARSHAWDVAEEIFLALAGLYPEAPEPLLDLAVLYEDRAESLIAAEEEELAEKFNELAFERYKTLLSMEPPFPEAFLNAGFFFLRRKNWEKAASLLETYSHIGPEGERRDRALAVVKSLRDRGYLDELFKEAYDFIRLGKEGEGLAKAELFLEKNPLVWNAWFLKGWALRRLMRWDEARQSFEKALALGADAASGDQAEEPMPAGDVYNELAICLLELDRLDEARRALEKALAKEPENVKIITNLGVVAFKQGRRSEAAGFFRTALEIEPEDRAAASWLANAEGED
ncbi:MAG TPA: tetratricopeptide repeat protein [Rectinemataceae bacterium]|nr:tetratricopeptide repeat protein [Rectinemataceae bacterium]